MPRTRLPVAAVVLAAAAYAAAHAQQPPPPSVQSEARLTTPVAEDALALDQKLIATAKDSSEVMKNLTHLSDVIGPRLTGSTNLRNANEWAAEVMKSYGLTNVRLEPWTIPL